MKPDFTTLKFSVLNTSLDDEKISLSLENDGETHQGDVVIFLERNHLGKLKKKTEMIRGTLGGGSLTFHYHDSSNTLRTQRLCWTYF